MTKEQIFRNLYANYVNRDAYLDRIPNDLQTYVFDNTYSNLLSNDCAMMINHIFGDAADGIFWFLYEWQPGYEVGYHEHERAIQNIDDYIDWMKNVEHIDLS